MPSFQVPVLGSTVGFLSPFPDSLPQLFLRCLPYAFAFGLSPSDPLSFVRFSSGSGYSASASSFPFSSCLRLTVASSVLRFRFRFFGSPRSLQPDLSCLPSRFRYSASCLFPFVLPCFAPTAVPQVLAFRFRLRPFPFFFRFLSSASFPVLTTQPAVLPFRSSRFHLSVVVPVRASAFASSLSPFSPA